MATDGGAQLVAAVMPQSMIPVIVLLVGSILLQVAAAVLAWRLVRVTGRSPWLLLSAAFLLMAGRRTITLWNTARGASRPDVDAEIVALGISTLLVVGVALIGPVLQRALQAARLVERTERRSTALLQTVLDVVLRLDGQGVVQYASPSVHGVLGFTPEALVGRRLWDIVEPDDADRIAQFFVGRVPIHGPAPPVLARVRHADGTWRIVEAVGNNQLADPAVAAIVVAVRDITERELAREVLVEREERLRVMFDGASDGIFVIDPRGYYLDANPATCQQLGYTRDELIGRHLSETIAPEDLEQRPLRLERLEEGATLVVQRQMIHRDGHRVHLEVNARMLTDGRFLWIARDLGERERATAAVEASERRFRRLVERGWDVIQLMNAEGVIRYITPSVERVLGRTVEEHLQRSGFEFLHPDDHAKAAAALAELTQAPDRVMTLELRLRHADGSWRWVEIVGSNQLHEPAIEAVVGVYHDITERKRAELARAARERRQGALAELGRYALEASDARRVAQRATSVLVEVLGVERASVLELGAGGGGLRLVAGAGWPAGLVGSVSLAVAPGSHADAALQRRAPVVVEDYEAEPGSETSALFHEHGVRGSLLVPVVAQDRPYGLLGVHADAPRPFSSGEVSFVQAMANIIAAVHERSGMERQLRTSETNYRELVQHVTYGLYRSTPSGRLLMANPAFAEVMGFDSVEELLAADVTSFYARPADRERLIQLYAHADRIDREEVDWIRRDGRSIRVQLSGRPVRNTAGLVEAFEMVVQDVTEIRALERQLRQAQKMEAVGQLTGGIAHDFNNILTTVLANADIIGSSLPATLQDLRRDVADIKTAATRGAELIRKLMAFSRRELLDVELLDVNDVVGDARDVLRRLLPETIELRVAATPTSDRVRADRSAVFQILLNLATNARDAMPNGGVLNIRTATVTVDDALARRWGFGRAGQYVCVEVEDTGVGMDDAVRTRLFEPFFTTKPVGKGTGLGLSMVYGLTKQHDGFVIVESEPDRGARFQVLLPVASPTRKSAASAPTAARATMGSRGTETILLVEDEESIRRSARRALEQFGYRVLTAVDGQDALRVLGRSEGAAVDLIMADVVMPRLSGRALYEAVQQQPRPPRFLFTSGYAQGEMPAGELVASDVPFLPKPWTVTELLARVRAVLDEPGPPRRPARAD
ncbi:MAG: PAS domain S-box protein [Gemmatimonadota bacterium]|nr:PAS domain S-box protein [Gemmatimonadota bacterium]